MCNNYTLFKEKIKKGAFTEKKIVEPEGVQHCLNCGAEFEGAFCPHCGQSCGVRRITAKNILNSVASDIIGLQANLPRTIIELFYRPGYLITDYLRGRRRNYSNPFSLLLLLATIFLFLDQFVFKNGMREASVAYSNSFEAGFNAGINPDAPVEIDNSQRYANDMINLIYDNFGLFSLAMIPLMAIPFWLAFRKCGQFKNNPMNISESVTIIAFISCQNMVVNLLSEPFVIIGNIGLISVIAYIILIPLYLLTTWQLFEVSAGKYILRHIIFFLYLLTIYIFSFGFLSIALGIYIALS